MKKVFIAGFLSGALLFGSVGAFAAGGKMIEVFYGVKDIKIDSVSQMPEKVPFMYEGTTFVPLRFVAEKLGQPVKWDSSSQTILIGETNEEISVYPGKGMESMNYQTDWSFNWQKYSYGKGTVKDNIGNTYDKYLLLGLDSFSGDAGWNYIEFPTNSNYKNFKATIGLTDDSKDTTRVAKLIIYADDKEVYSKNLKAGEMTEDIDVNIKNAVKVKIELKAIESGYDIEVGLFNARFVK